MNKDQILQLTREQQTELMIHWHKSGMTVSELANYFPWSYKVIRDYLVQYGLYHKICPKCGKFLHMSNFYSKAYGDRCETYCKLCKNKKSQKWYAENTEHHKYLTQKNYQENKDVRYEKHQEWFKKNPEKQKEYLKKYRSQKIVKIKTVEYLKQRKKNDPTFKLNVNLSTQICNTLKKDNLSKNGYSWESLVNYTVHDLKKHLENLFDDKMNWNNHGILWEIDHIVPRSFFDFRISGAVQACWSLENLTPVLKIYNREKNDTISDDFKNKKLSEKFKKFSKVI